MEAVKTSASGRKANDEVLGYVLQERIGSGGFGEVWRATAPGGLKKAIKFVYGAFNDQRASRELASLERIKGVHHPFLLSLERIEAVDDQLVIITALADASLKDRFLTYREQGLPGIPRDELIDYLSDTADALDFLHTQHTLQHLDIKPENLLVLGNHGMVADFGLVKDLEQTCASLLTGLTPTYSAPELFDGRPNQHSDQYSLAIVYQEMLTGERPFMGRTAAQLAAQHLHSEPTLGGLTPADRSILARALQKQPLRRFPSCSNLVRALREAERAVPRQTPRLARTTLHPDGFEKTLVLDEAGVIRPGNLADNRLPAISVRNLPAPEVDGKSAWLRPTLIVGVGGIAGELLMRLRRRLNSFCGDVENAPAVQMLWLDTEFTSPATGPRDGERPFPAGDQLLLPLRTPKEYRDDAPRLLASISRRWLYNVPRSLQTEAIRPLGRLALVDHYEHVYQRLKSSLAAVMQADAIATTAAACGQEFQNHQPRVVLLAGISGGTGSGAVIDLAYALQRAMAELGISDPDLCGIMVHAAANRTGSRDLAVANAYACLKELEYFHLPDVVYPGDEANKIPGCDVPTSPLASTYVVQLPDEGSPNNQADRFVALTDYLYLSLATPAAQFFTAARALTVDLPLAPFEPRTFGTSSISQFSARTVGQPWSTTAWLADATPALCKCGGAQRLLLSMPEPDVQQRLTKGLQRVYGASITTLDRSGDDIVLCSEVEQLSLQHVLAEITHGCGDYAKLASRLHTRTDIDWNAVAMV